jgi:hypothetical protein
MMRTSFILAVFAISIAVFGCGNDPGTGRLQIVLGDAPFPFDMISSAEITVDRVQVRIDAENDDESGWVTLPTAGGTYDLLALQNGITADLANAELPVGNVDQVRLVISRGRVELSDARVFVLNVPSGSSSGLKIFPRPPIAVVQDQTTDVLLDVDVSQSFQSIPAAPTKVDEISSFRFDPVLRVGNLTTGGSVSGHVFSAGDTPLDPTDDLPLANAMVMATANGDTTTTASDDTGYYRILGLAPGMWKVEASATGFLASSRGVSVVAGSDVGDTDFHLIPETAGP